MASNLFHSLSGGSLALLVVALLVALGFEFINGFHDTANAVATVIYTRSLPPYAAVALSGLCNFGGVFLGGLAVAMGIVRLLPVELLVEGGTGAALAMVLSLLLGAMIWNLGTWWLGLPASSSHTLIGSILGIGLANALVSGRPIAGGVNWAKAGEIGIALLVSPLIGFSLAALLLLLIKRYSRAPSLLTPPAPGKPPPAGTRGLLLLTCAGVSLAHGSNDGQKGVGIIMLVLIGLVPAGFAIDHAASAETLEATRRAAGELTELVQQHGDHAARSEASAVLAELAEVDQLLAGKASVEQVPADQRFGVRRAILMADRSLEHLENTGGLGLDARQAAGLTQQRKRLRALTDYSSTWVLVAVALALGLGTMIGWKRIVVTVGEKIGKSHLTYAQGASAELVAMSTIGLSAWLGVPVSTTHVLSSGVAGTMVAHRSGLRSDTVTSIALAWVLTLPMSMLLSALLFVGMRALAG